MDQTAQTISALMILAGFGLAQFGVLHEKSLLYLLMNMAGSAVLAVAGWAVHQGAFVLLEGSWALISTAGLAQWISRRLDVVHQRSPAADTSASKRSRFSSLGQFMKEISRVR